MVVVAAGAVIGWRMRLVAHGAAVAVREAPGPPASTPPIMMETVLSQNALPPQLASTAPRGTSSARSQPVAAHKITPPGAPPTSVVATVASATATQATPLASPPTTAASPLAAFAASPPPTVATADPPPARFDASHAHVEWSVVGNGGGATPGAVQRALSRSAGTWTRCYRSALERRGTRLDGTAVMHLATDESGNVVSAQVRGFEVMPGVRTCIADGSRVHIDSVDTGDSWADVQLLFKAE